MGAIVAMEVVLKADPKRAGRNEHCLQKHACVNFGAYHGTHTHTHLGIHLAATNPLEFKHCLMYHWKINFQGFRGQSGLQAQRLCCLC